MKTSPDNDFLSQVRQIREDARLSRDERRKREAEAIDNRVEQRVKTFEIVGRAREVIEQVAATLEQEVAGFERVRRFFDGRYMVALRERGSDASFSQIMFLLETGTEGELSVECHRTTRGTDLETTSTTLPMDQASLTDLRRFAEDQFLGFAESYFDGAPVAKPTAC